MSAEEPTPEIRYANSDGAHIAYQVIGDGPLDLVVVPGWLSNLDVMWADPHYERFLRGLASFSRLILFDERGQGLSDPVDHAPELEGRMASLRAVLDAVGSERAALLGISAGGPLSLLFAATHPGRTAALVLYGAYPTLKTVPGLPDTEPILASVRASIEHWGTGKTADWAAPSLAANDGFRRAVGRFERAAMSPGMARAMLEANIARCDVRAILGDVRVPTLVLHRVGEALPIEHGRYLAQHIPDARIVELDGVDHWPSIGDVGTLVGETEEFLTGTRHLAEPDRVLATVLFTDIVASTERSAALGDRAWHELLRQHDSLVRAQLERHRGDEVKHLGDGFLATFDGPARAVRCALDVTRDIARLGVEVRTGIHTGECELQAGDVRAIAVHIGARVGALAGPGEVLVSGTVRDLTVGSGLGFADRGAHTLKGVPGEWRLYAATGERPDAKFYAASAS